MRFSNNKTAQFMEGTFLVMENLRYSHSCNHVFDLKGSMRNRFVRTDDSEMDNVYQDENFLECEKLIYLLTVHTVHLA